MIRFFTPLRLGLLAALVVTVVAGFVLVPPGLQLPVHWGITGEADGFLPRDLALLVPVVIVALVWAIFLAVARFAPPSDIEAGRYVTGVALTALTAIFLAIEVMLVLIGLGAPVNVVQVLAVAFGLLLLVLGQCHAEIATQQLCRHPHADHAARPRQLAGDAPSWRRPDHHRRPRAADCSARGAAQPAGVLADRLRAGADGDGHRLLAAL